MDRREYMNKVSGARKRQIVRNHQAIKDFILRSDVLVEHWTLQEFGEDRSLEEEDKDDLLDRLEEEFPFLQFPLEGETVRWGLKSSKRMAS